MDSIPEALACARVSKFWTRARGIGPLGVALAALIAQDLRAFDTLDRFNFERVRDGTESSQPGELVEIVRDPVSEHSLGSAVRVCLFPEAYRAEDLAFREIHRERHPFFYPRVAKESWRRIPPQRIYFITPAHVLGGRRLVQLSASGRVRAEFIDETLDLALLSLPGDPRRHPCAAFARRLAELTAYDTDAAEDFRKSKLGVETPDASMSSVRLQLFSAILAFTHEKALAGRPLTGPLLLAATSGRLGESGGAVYSLPDLNGVTAEDVRFPDRVTRLVGMILAVDPLGRGIAALPAPTIYARLWKYFRTRQGEAASLQIRSFPGGVFYPALGAFQLRAGWREAGTGFLGDAGTGFLGDAGTGFLGDAGTGLLGDAGTGFLGDAASRAWALALPDGFLYAGRLWLSLRTTAGSWVESESLSPALLASLARGERPEGFYWRDGRYWATSAELAFPAWRPEPPDDASSSASGAGAESRSFDVSTYYRLAQLEDRAESSNDISLGRVRLTATPAPGRLDVTLVIEGTRPNGAARDAGVEFSKNYLWSARIAAAPATAGPDAGSFPVEIRVSEPAAPQTAYHPVGLRGFAGPEVIAKFTSAGGFRIQWKSAGRDGVMSGPLSSFSDDRFLRLDADGSGRDVEAYFGLRVPQEKMGAPVRRRNGSSRGVPTHPWD